MHLRRNNGYSVTEFRVTTGQTRNISDSPTKIGWVVGAGLEHRVWRNISVGVEYLHVELGNTTLTNASLAAWRSRPHKPFTERSDIVRARVNWLFGRASY